MVFVTKILKPMLSCFIVCKIFLCVQYNYQEFSTDLKLNETAVLKHYKIYYFIYFVCTFVSPVNVHTENLNSQQINGVVLALMRRVEVASMSERRHMPAWFTLKLFQYIVDKKIRKKINSLIVQSTKS